MRYTILVLSLALAASALVVEEKKCLGVGVICRDKRGVTGLCCANSYCPDPIVDVSKCTMRTDVLADQGGKKCAAVDETCMNIGGPTNPCCDGLKCHVLGPDRGVCRKSKGYDVVLKTEIVIHQDDAIEEDRQDDFEMDAKCLKKGQTCLSLGTQPGKCCKGYECKMQSTDHAVCVKAPKKAADTEEVSARVLVTQSLDIDLAALCAPRGGICYDLNRNKFKDCCPDFDCVMTRPEEAVGTCEYLGSLDADDQKGSCTGLGHQCASQNGRFASCCSRYECVYNDPKNPHDAFCTKKRKTADFDFDL